MGLSYDIIVWILVPRDKAMKQEWEECRKEYLLLMGTGEGLVAPQMTRARDRIVEKEFQTGVHRI